MLLLLLPAAVHWSASVTAGRWTTERWRQIQCSNVSSFTKAKRASGRWMPEYRRTRRKHVVDTHWIDTFATNTPRRLEVVFYTVLWLVSTIPSNVERVKLQWIIPLRFNRELVPAAVHHWPEMRNKMYKKDRELQQKNEAERDGDDTVDTQRCWGILFK